MVTLSFIFWHFSVQRAWATSNYKLNTLLTMNFGAADQGLLLKLRGDSGIAVIRDIILAHTSQLVLSLLYLSHNAIYTAQFGALEWSRFAHGNGKSLRVTWPKEKQRSTYWLGLPLKAGIPLVLLQILLHFLVSQSVFLARIR